MRYLVRYSWYCGYIHSSLKYGLICWGHSTNGKKLLTLQKRAIRYIVKAKKKTRFLELLFKSLNILTLISIYNVKFALLVKKINDQFIKNKVYYEKL